VTGANSLAVSGPSGVTGINESASTGAETIATNPTGNTGTLVAILGSGADTVLGGSGASTITAGSGSDVFAFIAGHANGTEVIIGFNGKDNLAFAGYAYTPTNLPTETVTALGDTLTLSDGTKIVLVGIDHKIFSA
jgi:Ca2+-binding RTX toxin-like protein